MSTIHPLPFRLRVPGADVIDSKGVRSVSYRLEGRAHFANDVLTLQWAGTRTTEQVSIKRIGTDVSHSPIGTLKVPVSWISDVRVRGGWWWPQIVLRARRLDAFDSVPGANPGIIVLKIRRADREHAHAFADAINSASATAPLIDGPSRPELGDTDGHFIADSTAEAAARRAPRDTP
jgi:hypothetical protein